MPELLSAIVFAEALTTVKGMLGVVLGVGALIFFHELGHFLAAKWAGVKVEVFSLGFGNRLCGFQRGGTDYRLSMLPLGGYVKMLGQADDDPGQAPTDREDDFRNKTVFQRFVILVAGVVMNILLAGFGFILAFGLGLEFNAPEIGTISPGSAASKADLRPGDILLEIDGHEILGWQDVNALVALSDGDIDVKVLRDGKQVTSRAKPFRGPEETYARLGISAELVVADVDEGSPLAQAGVLPATPTRCDTILNISPVTSRCDPSTRMSPREWTRVIDENAGPLALTIRRTNYDPLTFLPKDSELLELSVTFARKPVYTTGLPIPDVAYVRAVREDSAAARAGLKEGDRLISLAGKPLTRSGLQETVYEQGALHERPLPLVLERPLADGNYQRIETQVELQLQNESALKAALEGVTDPAQRLEIRREVGNWLLGIEHRADVIAERANLPLADEAAEAVALEPGDRVLSIWTSGGLWWNKEVQWLGPRMIGQLLNGREAEPFKISWRPKGSEEVRTAVVKAFPDPNETYANLGASLRPRQVVIDRGPLAACVLGAEQTLIQTRRILLTLRSFFTGMVSPRELGGPIQIVNVAYGVATRNSLAQLLHLLAILSVNLAVINILPIPVLDGGHIFFLSIEKLKGRPVSGEVMIWAQWVGLGCILALMALVFFNDITRLGQ